VSVYRCEYCHDNKRVLNEASKWVPCPYCLHRRGRGFELELQESLPAQESVITSATPRSPSGEGWSPANTALVLKAALYAGAAALLLYYFSAYKAEERDVLEPEAPELGPPATDTGEYSLWEPQS
jgi:hypothetical protein